MTNMIARLMRRNRLRRRPAPLVNHADAFQCWVDGDDVTFRFRVGGKWSRIKIPSARVATNLRDLVDTLAY